MSHAPNKVLLIVILTAAACAATPAAADTATALGDRSGEGSTAFTGLAQAPEANLFTGALGTSIPLELPPGRGPLTPQLGLQYSSTGGPSPFGFGWDLPVGRVERSTAWGAPRCTGAHTDDFVLVLPSGTVQLVREAAGSNYYRAKVEQDYLRAQRFDSQNYWVVVDRSGLRYTFGNVDAARVGNSTPLTFLAVTADGTCRLTNTWALTKIEAPDGAYVDVAWSKVFNVLYPATVRYGGTTAGGGRPHVHTVAFAYEERPPGDRIFSYRGAARARLSLRLRTIDVRTDVPARNTAVRAYSLQYRDRAPDGETDGYQSILSAVSVTGRPTQHFVYTPSYTGHRSGVATLAVPPGASTELRIVRAGEDVTQTLLDMNGDGILDLVRSDDPPAASWAVYWGSVNSSGTFAFRLTPTAWQVPTSSPVLRQVAAKCATGWSCTETDTFDITGDGIPDFVDARNGRSWTVYQGRGSPAWGFAPGVAWPAPNQPHVRRTFTNRAASWTYQDVADLNGDGLPDLVVIEPSRSAPFAWRVYLNTGSGFAATPLPAFAAPVGSLTMQISTIQGAGKFAGSEVRHLLTDFNGDGLPDLVRSGFGSNGPYDDDPRCHSASISYASCLEVYFNTGQGFEAAPSLIPVPPSTAVQQTDQNRGVFRDLVDVNADGLPDLVIGSPQSEWEVLFNLGGTLEALGSFSSIGDFRHDWPGAQGYLRQSSGIGYRNSRADLVDIDGDGFLDHVTAGGTTWSVRLHGARERPNLLGLMENGLGGTSTIVYRPSTAYDNTGGDTRPDLPFVTWVVDKTRQNDGQCTPPAGADPFSPSSNPCIDAGSELLASFSYQDGRFDPVEREFRGFRRVVRTSSEGSKTPGNQTVMYFAQDSATKGRTVQIDAYAGSSTLVRREQNWWNTRTAGANGTQIWLAAHTAATYDLTGSAQTLLVTAADPPDAYGNITHHYNIGINYDTGTGASGAVRLDTFTTYAAPQSGSEVRDRPANVRVADGFGAVLAEEWFFYDGDPGNSNGLALGTVGQGKLKRARRRLSASDPNGPETKLLYDAYGNLLKAIDANGHTTATTYDPYGAIYPTSVTTALNHTTTTAMEYGLGRPASVTEPSGAVTQYAYDDAGRLTCLARPGDSLAACSTATAYHVASQSGELSWVEVRERQDGPHPPLTTRFYFDALGRPRYADSFRVVDGAPTTVRSNHVVYDAGGRVRLRYDPYVVASGPNNGATAYDYHLNGSPYVDPFGRLFRTTHPDGTSRRTEYAGATTTSFDEEGQRTDTVADAFGRVVTQSTYSGGTVYAATERTYDALGRLLSLRQNGVLMESFAYDALGRKTQMVDADSGTWRYGYDGAGNLRWQDDPRTGHHVELCYDAQNRIQRRCSYPNDFQSLAACSSACTDPEAVIYTYDDAAVPYAKGRLTTVDDVSGTTRVGAYDARGRKRSFTKTVELRGSTRTGSFEFAYDANDRVISTKYPDGEVVFTEYDDAGQPIALYNNKSAFYVTDALYDVFGRPTRIDHANGVVDTRAYGGPADRHRLTALRSAKRTTAYLDLAYADYSDRGLITRIADRRDPYGVLTNSATFTYDALGRLTNFDSAHDAVDSAFAYSALGNLTRRGDRYLDYGNAAKPHQITAVRTGSPTAAAQPVSHDANGNRETKGAQRYEYDGSNRLARVHVYDRGQMVEFTYDYAGQVAGKSVHASTTTTTTFFGRLAEATGASLNKWYYLGPLRVASQRSDWALAAAPGDGPTWLAGVLSGQPASIGGLAGETRWLAGGVCLCVAVGLLALPGRRRPVVGIAVRPGQAVLVAVLAGIGTLPWPPGLAPASAATFTNGLVLHYHLDHLGSTQVVTHGGTGDIIEQVRYAPYGGIRGHWNGSKVLAEVGDGNRREFEGYISDPASGLQHAGARVYDPDIGSFLTHDPSVQFASPYGFGGGDPVNWSDPTGATFGLGEFLFAIVIGAALSATINAVVGVAAGQSASAVHQSILFGAASGAAAAGLGVVAAGASIGAAVLSKSAPASLTWEMAHLALREVAVRSTVSSGLASLASQSAAAAGAPRGLVILSGLAAGAVGGFAYDSLNPNLNPVVPAIGGTEVASQVSTGGIHANSTLTSAAAVGRDMAEHTRDIVRANLAEDEGLWNLLTNETHFDFRTMGVFGDFAEMANLVLRDTRSDFNAPLFYDCVGRALHHLQDRYALGHIFPGTGYLPGPWWAPVRFVIHNVVGGEVTFREAQDAAGTQFLGSFQAIPI